jgi:hypothetical protein
MNALLWSCTGNLVLRRRTARTAQISYHVCSPNVYGHTDAPGGHAASNYTARYPGSHSQVALPAPKRTWRCSRASRCQQRCYNRSSIAARRRFGNTHLHAWHEPTQQAWTSPPSSVRTRARTRTLFTTFFLCCAASQVQHGVPHSPFVLSPHTAQPPVCHASSRPRSCSAATPAAWRWTSCVARSCQVRQHRPHLSFVFGQSVPPSSHRPSTRCLHGQTRSGRHWQPPQLQSSPQR